MATLEEEAIMYTVLIVLALILAVLGIVYLAKRL